MNSKLFTVVFSFAMQFCLKLGLLWSGRTVHQKMACWFSASWRQHVQCRVQGSQLVCCLGIKSFGWWDWAVYSNKHKPALHFICLLDFPPPFASSTVVFKQCDRSTLPLQLMDLSNTLFHAFCFWFMNFDPRDKDLVSIDCGKCQTNRS